MLMGSAKWVRTASSPAHAGTTTLPASLVERLTITKGGTKATGGGVGVFVA